jgi:outer membrane protein W
MRKLAGLAILALGVTLFTVAPAVAQEHRTAIRYFVSYMSPTGDDKFDDSKVAFQQTWGVGLGFEPRITPTIGLDVALKFYKPGVKLTVPGASGEKRVQMWPITIGPMFHFGKGVAGFYAGPELAYVSYGRIASPITATIAGPIKIKDEFTWGVKGGVDVPLGGGDWAFSATLEYIDAKSKVDVTDGPDLNSKPILVAIGFAYRF